VKANKEDGLIKNIEWKVRSETKIKFWRYMDRWYPIKC